MPEWLRMQNNTRRQRQANKTDDRDKKEENGQEVKKEEVKDEEQKNGN